MLTLKLYKNDQRNRSTNFSPNLPIRTLFGVGRVNKTTMNILESVKGISHCDITHDKIKCKFCKEEMNSPKKSKTLQDHLMTIYGFSLLHKKCIPNDLKQNDNGKTK